MSELLKGIPTMWLTKGRVIVYSRGSFLYEGIFLAYGNNGRLCLILAEYPDNATAEVWIDTQDIRGYFLEPEEMEAL